MSAETDATRVSGSYGFNAPAEVVFGVLTDPDRAARWLPGSGVVDSASPERVRINGGTPRDYGVEIAPDDAHVTDEAGAVEPTD